jgi:hypothetical protein
LGYTLVFPIAQAGFYYVTLQYRRLMNWIQQKIQDETPLPQEKANEILRENVDLQLELDKKIIEINNIKKREQLLTTKEQEIIKQSEDKNKELEKSFKDRVNKEKKLLAKSRKQIVGQQAEIETW